MSHVETHAKEQANTVTGLDELSGHIPQSENTCICRHQDFMRNKDRAAGYGLDIPVVPVVNNFIW